MLAYLWDRVIRFRTWLVNLVFGAILTPDVILTLLGYNWGTIIPAKYMPLVGIVIAVANVWMRPRPAARKADK